MKTLFILMIIGSVAFGVVPALADGGSIVDLVEGSIQDGRMSAYGVSETSAEYNTEPRVAGEASVSNLLKLKTNDSFSGVQQIEGMLKANAMARTFRVDPSVSHVGKLETINNLNTNGVKVGSYSLNKSGFSALGPNFAHGYRESAIRNTIKTDGAIELKLESTTYLESESW